MTGLLDRILNKLADTTNRVEAKNTEAWVNLASYNSPSKTYTFPADGYIFSYHPSNDSSTITVLGATDGGSTIAIGSTNARDSLFVKKGMKCYVSGTISAARYTPIS